MQQMKNVTASFEVIAAQYIWYPADMFKFGLQHMRLVEI